MWSTDTTGAGKTTLLRILAGKHKVPEAVVSVLGQPPFYATELTTSGAVGYIGGNWERDVAFAGYSVPLQVVLFQREPCPCLSDAVLCRRCLGIRHAL